MFFSLEFNCQLQTFIELFLKSQSDDRKSPDDLFQTVAQNHKQSVSDTLKSILQLYSAVTAAVSKRQFHLLLLSANLLVHYTHY